MGDLGIESIPNCKFKQKAFQQQHKRKIGNGHHSSS